MCFLNLHSGFTSIEVIYLIWLIFPIKDKHTKIHIQISNICWLHYIILKNVFSIPQKKYKKIFGSKLKFTQIVLMKRKQNREFRFVIASSSTNVIRFRFLWIINQNKSNCQQEIWTQCNCLPPPHVSVQWDQPLNSHSNTLCLWTSVTFSLGTVYEYSTPGLWACISSWKRMRGKGVQVRYINLI